METRIKYIKKNLNDGYYAVQVRKWLFWKTVYTDTVFVNVEKFIDTLAQIDEFNNKANTLNELVYEGWAVRNVYKVSGPSYSVNFFKSPIHKRQKDDCNCSERTWADINDNIVPLMEIKAKELFGKECVEPMKLRITIEQIEE